MLILAHSLRELRLRDLMEVYADSNREKASDWPNLPPMFALQLAEQDHREYLQDIFFRTGGAVLAVWEENRTYVSALRLEPYKDGLLLNALETAPVHRKKGYAVRLIRAVQENMGNVKIYSHVNKRNMPSLKTHEACGFRVISDCAVFLSGSVDYRSCTLLYEG